MVDIHSHILPYIDDGAETLEEAVAMAELAADSGINHIVTSSHGNYYSYSLDEYNESFNKFQEILKEKKIPVTLYPGMEIFLDEYAIQLIKQNRLLSLNKTNYILVEFPFEESVKNVCNRIAALQSCQYRIILAHPERYIFVQKDPELAYYLEEQGCVLQVNQGSLMGDFGEKCRQLASRMLNDGIVGVIATDAHDTKYRSPSIHRLLDYLYRNYSPAEIRLWLSENPSRILKGYPTAGVKLDIEKEHENEKN